MKFFIFLAVNYQFLIQFIRELNFIEVDIESFDILKKNFYFPRESIPNQRWKNLSTILSIIQLRDLIISLDSFLGRNQNLTSKLQEIIFTSYEF
jgi:hypothetical protein